MRVVSVSHYFYTGQLTGNLGQIKTWCLANWVATTCIWQCSHVSNLSGHVSKCLSKSTRIKSALHLFGQSILSYWHNFRWDCSSLNSPDHLHLSFETQSVLSDNTSRLHALSSNTWLDHVLSTGHLKYQLPLENKTKLSYNNK